MGVKMNNFLKEFKKPETVLASIICIIGNFYFMQTFNILTWKYWVSLLYSVFACIGIYEVLNFIFSEFRFRKEIKMMDEKVKKNIEMLETYCKENKLDEYISSKGTFYPSVLIPCLMCGGKHPNGQACDNVRLT